MIVGVDSLKSLTIATPFYNESEGLNNYFKTLNKINKLILKKIKVKYLFIDDGSVDNTLIKLFNFKKKNKSLNIKIYKHKVNQGYGRTLKNSIHLCDTDYLITYDSDCSYDYRLISKLIKKIQLEKLDIINVSFKLSKQKTNISFFRKTLSIGSTIINNIFFPEIKKYEIQVLTCSFRIYRTNKINKINLISDDFNCCAELLIKSMKKRLKIREIAGKNQGRKFGKSKMKIIKNIINTLKMIYFIKFKD